MYFRTMVAKEAGQDPEAFQHLDNILKELFRIFFPDKEYLGVRAEQDGSVSFPVKLISGEEHDINDLSSGEKEVLYGYLRLRSSTPGNSTILLDEPELHLNPALLQGFPDFYYRHLAKEANNQVWLVTHSDVLLRQAVGNPNFTVLHMLSASLAPSDPTPNQAVVIGEDDLQAAVLDLVGDLAAYRPTGKVVIFEGGGNSDFDVAVVDRLFPQIGQNNNLISGGSKLRVATLRNALQRAAGQSGIADRLYAITDRDSDTGDGQRQEGSEVLSWDVYHIENYLLEPKYLHSSYQSLTDGRLLADAQEADAAARQLARERVERLVLVRLQDEVNASFRRALNVGAPPDSDAPAQDLMPSIETTFERLDALRLSVGDSSALAQRESAIRTDLEQMFNDDSWRNEFPGRIILKAFVGKYLGGNASYEGFVNLILTQMVSDGFRPPGMVRVLQKIFPSMLGSDGESSTHADHVDDSGAATKPPR